MQVEIDAEALQEELIKMLRSQDVLASLSDEQIAYLAELAVLKEYKSGETILRRGDPGDTFYFVIEGQLRAIDTQSEPPKLLTYLHHDQFFGERALLFGTPRSATVDVAVDAIIAIFDRSAWMWLINAKPEVIENFQRLEAAFEHQSHIEFPGRQVDEVVIRQDKRHILAFVATLPVPLILMILGLGIGIILGELDVNSVIIRIVTVLSLLFGIGLIIYNYADWVNDDFIITSDRIIHIERTIIYGESREEAPLTAIQDVGVNIPNLFTRLFGYYNVVIQTAGAGTIIFDGLKDGQEIRETIFEQRNQARERVEASDTSAIRKSLVDRMQWDVGPVEVPTLVATGDAPQEGRGIDLPVVINYLIPRVKESQANTIIWRKHYFILFRLVAVPLVALFAVLYLILAALVGVAPFGDTNYGAVFVFLVLWSLTWLWYTYQYDTWRKDIYIVTDRAIRDVHGSPFGLGREQSREGTFDNIQNTTYNSPSFLTRILNMGDVIIETAGTADTFTFKEVYDYREVQQEISKRLIAFKEAERKKTRGEEERRYIRWLGEYHDLQQESGELHHE